MTAGIHEHTPGFRGPEKRQQLSGSLDGAMGSRATNEAQSEFEERNAAAIAEILNDPRLMARIRLPVPLYGGEAGHPDAKWNNFV